MNTKNQWIRTASGNRLHVIDPVPEEIFIDDIAYALSNVMRFCGHAKRRYSVCEHSIRVMARLPDHLKLQGLMHDASEFCLNDIPKPAKNAMPDYKRLETRMMEVIAKRFQFKWPLHPAVKDADCIMLVAEARDLMGITTEEEMNDFMGGGGYSSQTSWLEAAAHIYIPDVEPTGLAQVFVDKFYSIAHDHISKEDQW